MVSTHTHPSTHPHRKAIVRCVRAGIPANQCQGWTQTRDDTCRPGCARRPQDPGLGVTWSEVSARRRPSRGKSSLESRVSSERATAGGGGGGRANVRTDARYRMPCIPGKYVRVYVSVCACVCVCACAQSSDADEAYHISPRALVQTLRSPLLGR